MGAYIKKIGGYLHVEPRILAKFCCYGTVNMAVLNTYQSHLCSYIIEVGVFIETSWLPSCSKTVKPMHTWQLIHHIIMWHKGWKFYNPETDQVIICEYADSDKRYTNKEQLLPPKENIDPQPQLLISGIEDDTLSNNISDWKSSLVSVFDLQGLRLRPRLVHQRPNTSKN